jgi:hypothetical protein
LVGRFEISIFFLPRIFSHGTCDCSQPFASWSWSNLATDNCWCSRLTWDDTSSRTLIKGINVPCFLSMMSLLSPQS